jgi:hypothetical protein
MESVIARLLSEFENGKMTRRQRSTSLASAAMEVPVAAAVAQRTMVAPVARSASSLRTSMWLRHIADSIRPPAWSVRT